MKITHTFLETYTENNPFYLQNLMYDLPFELEKIEKLTIELIVPKGLSAYIIDDIEFLKPITNTIEITVQEDSSVEYQLYVANHQLCDMCPGRQLYDCRSMPTKFEKNVFVTLAQPGGTANVKCHYLGDGQSEFHIKTVQHHKASGTKSQLIVKGVLDEASKLVSNNSIVVDEHLSGISANQSNQNLILSDKARVISIPKLQVKTKNAACRHGMTSKSLDQEELFYLMSRGIERKAAEYMLIEAFLK